MEIGSRKRKSATETVGPERAREVVRQPSVLRRKRAQAGCEAFDVKKEDALGFGARNVLQQRFQSELGAVRRLVRKAAAMQRSETPPAKRIKASPPRVIKAVKKVSDGEREQLKADLAKLASELPDHIMELLMKHCRAIRGGEMEIDIDAVQDEAILELRKQLDEFVREKMPDQEHQDGNMMAQEEEEDVDIVGGVFPLAIVPAPLQLAEEEDEDVDICGDASPVAMPKNLGGDAICSGSPSSSSSSDDSDSHSDSDSASDSDSDESVDSPAPAERATTPPRTELIARAKESLERQRKEEARRRAREKARQDVLEAERTAMPTETIHWTVIKSLDIHEYGLCPYSLLRLLGLSLKVEEYGIEQQQPRQSLEEELEEGEIRL